MLDRVKIMRVFDFAGLMEAVGEIGGVCRELEREGGDQGRNDLMAREEVITKELAGEESGGVAGVADSAHEGNHEERHDAARKRKRWMIADSQADDYGDALNDLELEMVMDEGASVQETNPSPQQSAPPSHAPSPPQELSPHRPSSPNNPQTLLILSSLPRLLSPIMHTNHIRGHALLVHLLRSLRHLTQSHQLCCLILNSVVGGSSRTDTDPRTAGSGDNPGNKEKGEEGVSIFSDNGALRPALGKTFAWRLDVSLLVSTIGRGGGGQEGRGKGGTSVCEVVSDRFGAKAGRWCVLE